jgi:hypothetical protein
VAYRTCWFRRDDGSKLNRFFIFDTEAELLTQTLIIGDMGYCLDTQTFNVAISETSWKTVGGSLYVDIMGSGTDAITITATKRLVFDGA